MQLYQQQYFKVISNVSDFETAFKIIRVLPVVCFS